MEKRLCMGSLRETSRNCLGVSQNSHHMGAVHSCHSKGSKILEMKLERESALEEAGRPTKRTEAMTTQVRKDMAEGKEGY